MQGAIPMLLRTATLLTALSLTLAAPAARAWSNHALCTWPALAALPEVAALPPAPAESLAAFVKAEAPALQQLLEAEEQWALRSVPNYPARPAALAFRADPQASADELLKRFVAALRINPGSKLSLFQQLRPGQGAGRALLSQADVTPLKTQESSKSDAFVALREGEPVAVVDILATASDEPDYGLDIGLWSDNGTAHGAAYGFGRQPFGNPAVEFASQAPMHMSFFHEASIVYRAAPFLGRTFPEYRVHLWRSLAVHALKSGHPYWGWRFAGWALHYLQDLTQPYHARVLPGVGTARLLGINTIDMVGISGPKARAITFVSNRHLALENYQLRWLREAHLSGRDDNAAFRALRDASLDAGVVYNDDSPRQAIAKAAHAAADATDEAVVDALPPKYTSEPGYNFGVTESGLDLRGELAKDAPQQTQAMEAAITPLLKQFGLHTRSFVRSLLPTR